MGRFARAQQAESIVSHFPGLKFALGDLIRTWPTTKAQKQFWCLPMLSWLSPQRGEQRVLWPGTTRGGRASTTLPQCRKGSRERRYFSSLVACLTYSREALRRPPDW